jgi:RNA 3'-terminal phosphate cyclase (ATP)
MIQIDGSAGEGGGQVLRSSLTLSVLTGQPVQLHHIRARRPKPGLAAQHLKAVEAAAAVSGATVHGAHVGSTTLTFEPGKIRAGDYHFDIGTAGATSLVLQTIFLPLSLASAPSQVSLIGGTHVPWSPAFHYLELQWLPTMRAMGCDAALDLAQAGFYPKGGGRIDATIRPAQLRQPLQLVRRGPLQRVQGISGVANLPRSIAERQRQQAVQRLHGIAAPVEIDVLEMPALGQGTFLLLLAECTEGQACYVGLGERGKPAERVADEAADQLVRWLRRDGAIDQYLVDQLLLPSVLADGPSILRTSQVTQHLLTNADVIRQFLPARIEIDGALGQVGMVRIEPHGEA